MARSLRKEFAVSVGAGTAAIRINTDGMDDALKTLTEVAQKYKWELRVWDHTLGTVWYNGERHNDEDEEKKKPPSAGPAALAEMLSQSPDAPPNPLTEVIRFLQERPRPDKATQGEVQPVLLVMKNFHLAFETRDRGAIVSAVQHIIGDKVRDHPDWGRLRHGASTPFRQRMEVHGVKGMSDTGKFLIGLMPATDDQGNPVRLPPEISPAFHVINHELPDVEELEAIFDGVVTEPVPEATKRLVLLHARGLTRLQAEGIFGTYFVQCGAEKDFAEKFPEHVWKEKSEVLNQDKLVTLYEGKETFKDVVGQAGTKAILRGLLRADKFDPDNPDLKSKGVTLVGGPRTGKTLIIKTVGNETGLPILQAHPGNLMGSHVGDTERLTRRFFQLVKAHAPCIVFIDEVEKVMPSGKGEDHDSGVGKRMAGTFMSQMQDMTEQVFWAFTANSIEELHEAFLDDDRIDLKIYVGMPTPEARAAGWRMYLGKFFPAEVGGTSYPRHFETDFGVVLKELKAAKKIDPAVWGHRFVATLLCLHGEGRAKALDRLRAVDDNVYQTVTGLMFSDDGWTLARVKSVCRLARKLDQTLSETAQMVPGRQTRRMKMIQRLERWAAEEAVDAETGRRFVPQEEREEAEEDEPSRKKETGGNTVRRKVRKI